MRVLFLTDSLSDLDGVGRYALRLIAALEAEQPGLEVHVLLAHKHRPTSAGVPPNWRVDVCLPPDYFFYMSPARYAVWSCLATLRAWRAARRADLVHAIKDYPHSRVALLAARLAGKPCVATAHGTYTIQPVLSPRHRGRARRTYAGFARIVSVSRHTRERLLGILSPGELDPDKVVVIPNAVAAEHYREPRAVGERPWHPGPFTLGIGELKERKGHHLALEAWCRVARERPDLEHYLVGNRSHDDYEERLLALVREAGMAERVHLLGNVTEDDKIDLLQRAAAFVHTPVTAADGGFEGFGIVYLEASAAGTAVLGTRDSGAEDAVVDGVTGLLVEPRVDAVEAALRRLLSEPGLRERLGAGGREHAAASTWKANATRVLEVYREELG